MSSQPLPPKKVVALAILEQSMVNIHLDPRLDGVVVPPNFKRQPQLQLQIGLNMPVPIPDLYFDDEKMSCTLSFARTPFFCIIPWASVFAMVGEDGRGMVWPESLPPEIARARAPEQALQAKPAAEERRLKAVPSPAAEPKEEAKTSKEKSTPKKAAAKKSAAKKSAAKKTAKPEKKAEKTVDKKTAKSAKPTPKKATAKKEAPQKPARAKKEEKRAAAETLPEAPVVKLPERADGKPRDRVPPGRRIVADKPKRELPPYLRVVK